MTEPLGRTPTRIFVIVLLLIILALALWSAVFLIQTARESADEPAVPDTTTTSVRRGLEWYRSADSMPHGRDGSTKRLYAEAICT